jgi:putative sterol carrier protein
LFLHAFFDCGMCAAVRWYRHEPDPAEGEKTGEKENRMAEQAPISENVSPDEFFEQLLPMGFAAQAQEGNAPQDLSLQFRLTGDSGGEWAIAISGGAMTARKGSGDAHLTMTLSVDDWRDAVLGRNGAALGLIIPPRRPGRPDNSARVKTIKGTLALELAREGKEPFKLEMCFNNAATPRTVLRMKIEEHLALLEGRLNGQEAFMTGKLRVEGDLAFLMQIATLNA